jgi:hypothetical protein
MLRRHSWTLLWATLIALVLAGLYWGLQASRSVGHVVGPGSRIYRLSIPSGAQSLVLEATQGDTVTFVIRSDRPGELHVHAAEEKAVALKPGGEVRLTFVAKDAGGFAVHLHDPDGSMHHIAILEVQPK